MRKFLIAALMVAGPAFADDMVYTDGNVSVRLQSTPCVAPVANLIRDEIVPKSKAGIAIFRGRTLRICWAIITPGIVTIVDEDGDGGSIPQAEFKRSPGV